MSIVLDGLTKRYGTHSIVDRLSLEVQDRELFVLLGASGSGKSTVLRMIAGLAPVDEGKILLHGQDVTWMAPQRRGVGFVFQNYTIFRHMSVADNIAFGLRVRRVSKAERSRRTEELLDLVGLGGLGRRYAHQLSGGQQQRVALARALAYEPSVLLLDEPFGALDVKIRAQLRRSLKEVQRKLRVTMILVTHDQEEAFELADRIGVLEHGRLVEVGAPERMYAAPGSEFAATFLGAANLIVGLVREGVAVLGGLTLPIPPETPHEDGARARILVRPEQVLLAAEKPPAEVPVLGRGTVLDQTFAGSTRRLRLRLPRLRGTRQVAPVLPFGEDGLLLDVVLPAELALPDGEVWVGLRGYHVLQQAPWRLWLRGGGDDPQRAETLAAWLAERLPAEIIREIAPRMATDVMVVPGDADRERLAARIHGLLQEPDMPPILVTIGNRTKLEHLLVCTAVGEPGKRDVLVGGRLARRIGAAVTLFHAVRLGDEPTPRVLIHLERSLASLRSLDIQGRIHLREGADPVESILEEARASEADVVVLGAPRGGPGWFSGRGDVTLGVLTEADRPVLIVPPME